MSNFIHPTSLIDPAALIGEGNYIGPYCIIGPNVTIGDNNRFEAFVSIGTAAEHRDFFLAPPGPVAIGSGNVLREYVTVNGGIASPTTIQNKCSLLKSSHVGHDAVLRDHCNLGCHAIVGGHSILDVGANMGLASVVHQNRIIGAYAMIGMNSAVTKSVLPFSISFGSPSEVKRLNRIGLQRAGVTADDLAVFAEWFEFQNFNHEICHELNHKFNSHLTEYFKLKNSFMQK